MAREYKFRIFDKQKKKMYLWEQIKDCYQQWIVGLMNGSSEEQILMQFTGLTCNGYEWFEGDILENDSDWYQIVWDKEDALWRAEGIGSTNESLELFDLLSNETWLQGNIYENPELLSGGCDCACHFISVEGCMCDCNK